MCIHQSNRFVEWLARIRLFVLRRVLKAEPVEHVDYHHGRWYKLNRRGQVVKVARTYFDVMQPY